MPTRTPQISPEAEADPDTEAVNLNIAIPITSCTPNAIFYNAQFNTNETIISIPRQDVQPVITDNDLPIAIPIRNHMFQVHFHGISELVWCMDLVALNRNQYDVTRDPPPTYRQWLENAFDCCFYACQCVQQWFFEE